ncbi:MAG: peptidylprolyl isomerase [Gammaproteobacteria bacterium]
MIFRLLFPTLLVILIGCNSVSASIVRVEFSFGANPAGEVYIELFDEATPLTAANFLNYIENSAGERRYDGTFLHRSVNNFVIQGGGYKYDPLLGAFNLTSAPHIETDAQILNEFDISRSNLRGTVAMAKLGGNPNSASSEWFFNLNDNSANLDNQNGGFTVFGQVLGTGMDVIDSIAALPTVFATAGTFSDLPVTNFTALPVTEDNLVTIKPTTYLSGDPVNFGLISQSATIEGKQLIIKNSNTATLQLGSVDVTAIESPFVVRDNCSGLNLAPDESCSIDINLNPATTAAGDYSGIVGIPVPGSDTPYLASVSARIGETVPTLNIKSGSPVDLGLANPAEALSTTIELENIGVDDLQINSLILTGADAGDFSLTENNCNTTLAFTETCTTLLNFQSGSIGEKLAQLDIDTTPANQTTQLAITATISTDKDGIPDSIENAAPNNGDMNQDGIADSQQENVASFPSINGQYLALEVSSNLQLVNVAAIENPIPAASPVSPVASINFPYGFLQFTVTGLQAGESAAVTIHLPESVTSLELMTYYKLDSRPPFFFAFDQRTAGLPAGTGAEVFADKIILHLVDGKFGDSDAQANGTIVDPGGIAIVTPTITNSDDSGGGCSLSENRSSIFQRSEWLLLVIWLMLLRRKNQKAL